MKGKNPKDSAVSDQIFPIFPNDLNSNDTVFGGHVMALLDRLSLVVAERHSERTCVTVSVDAMHFLAPAVKGDNLVIHACVNKSWSSSMEIGLKVCARNPRLGKKKHIVSAYYTFVAVDANGKPIPVPEIIPETKCEKRRFEEAEIRRKNRMKQAEELKAFRKQYDS